MNNKNMRRFDLIELTHAIDVCTCTRTMLSHWLLLIIEWINYVLARTQIERTCFDDMIIVSFFLKITLLYCCCWWGSFCLISNAAMLGGYLPVYVAVYFQWRRCTITLFRTFSKYLKLVWWETFIILHSLYFCYDVRRTEHDDPWMHSYSYSNLNTPSFFINTSSRTTFQTHFLQSCT